ncbi:MAG: ATP synthase F0 subunit C [Candidatus Aminicenantes bacterium]|nr:ATP synthase F0 subunit C [Candidatus Aminicenantes bacterium]
MTIRMKSLFLLVFFVLLAVAPILAQDRQPQDVSREGQRMAAMQESRIATELSRASLYRLSLIVAGGIITLAVMAGAFCQAKAISSACEGISRNPGGAPHIRFLLLLGLILIETLVIYALLVTFIILMVKWGKFA